MILGRLLSITLTLFFSTALMSCQGEELSTEEILHILGNDDIAEVFVPYINDDSYEEKAEESNSTETINSTRPVSARKASSYSSKLWEKIDGVPTVHFAFGSTPVSHQSIKKAIEHIETHTCIRFIESNGIKFRSRMIFDDSSGCNSNVGRTKWLFGLSTAQSVNLGYLCHQVRTIIHEICHALGLWHEQNRSDRDAYVKVIYDNLRSKNSHNFQIKSTENFHTEYDFFSVMHYGQFGFTSNGGQTLTTLDPMMKGLITVPRFGLSFMDKSILNKLYGCVDTWISECGTNGTNPCHNLGYLGKACKCICPLGTSGDMCEVKEQNYSDALAALLTPKNEVIKKPTNITSGDSALLNMVFTKLIQAPPGFRIVLTVLDFETHFEIGKPPKCLYQGVEVGTSGKVGAGRVYCGKQLKKGQIFKSKSNQMIIFYWKQTLYQRYERGFTFGVHFESVFQQCKINAANPIKGLFANCHRP
ncbi:Peptidase M12A [Trinorchestia longiramus]|nr:Peptidase M12A [Trinorchestia longiramus]